MDINNLPSGHESVDRGIVDQDDLDIFRFKLGGFDQRTRHIAQQCLGLRIAQNGLRGDRLKRQRESGEKRKESSGEGTIEGHIDTLLTPLGLNGN